MGSIALLAAFPFARMVQNKCLESTKNVVQDRLESAEKEAFRELEATKKWVEYSYTQLEAQAKEDIFTDLIPRLEASAIKLIEQRIVGTSEDYDDLISFSGDIGDSDSIAKNQE